MTSARTITGVAVVTVCALGAAVLHLLGVPWPISIAIGILAGAATIFTGWAGGLYRRRRAQETNE